MRVSRLLWVVAFLAPAPVFADVVVLSNGQEIIGVVTETGDQVEVRVDAGSVSFARSDVAEIRRGDTNLLGLEQRRAKLDAGDAAGRLALARWAEQQGLGDSARELYREVLALRPDDPTARERLGFRKYDGRWMNEEERLVATGHVQYGGRWVTKEEAAQLENEARERRRLQDLESQVVLQQKKIDELESKAEAEPAPSVPVYTDDNYGGYGAYGWYGGYGGYGGWWLPQQQSHQRQHSVRSHRGRAHGRAHRQSPAIRGQLQPLPGITANPAIRR